MIYWSLFELGVGSTALTLGFVLEMFLEAHFLLSSSPSSLTIQAVVVVWIQQQ